MLDDLSYIHEKDQQDALGVAEKQPTQYLYSYGFDWKAPRWIYNVIIAGMGGSALAAKAYKQTPGLSVPFEVVQDYAVPDLVTRDTLFIASSYSGNTEETVSCLKSVVDLPDDLRPMIVIVSCGGELGKIANQYNLPMIKLPEGYQPPHTFGFQYRALAEIFNSVGLQDSFISSLEQTAKSLDDQIKQWLPSVHTDKNQAKQIAEECLGKSIVVYSGTDLAAAAYKWKISFNENAKAIAWWGTYPEFNHNEFLGWTKLPEQKPYTVIELRSHLDHHQITKRFEISNKLLSGQKPEPIIVEAIGDSKLEQLLTTVALGDFASLYLALLTGQNPTPVDLIEKLKKELV